VIVSDLDQAIERMWPLFERVIAFDTSPGTGEHRVASDDPRLASFIADLIQPELEAIGASTSHDSAGNLLATFGSRSGHELLMITYPATHHGNLMSHPLRARRVEIGRVAHWVGQGASEGKASLVCLIDALRQAHLHGVELGGRVMVAVSTEGSSTNNSSNTMLDEMGALPAAAALIIGTGNAIALGHRGRADILVTTAGIARHSSVAAGLPNPIDRICRAQQRVADWSRSWASTSDGVATTNPESAASTSGRSLTPYRMVCGPVAPHTMPERCELALDCRVLPGDDIARLRDDIARAIDDDDVDVAVGPVMLAASIAADDQLVTTFAAAAKRAGFTAATFVPPWTFDAGATSSRGIPTVLFGPSTDNTSAIDQIDAVSTEMLGRASATLLGVLSAWRR
jgi:succinyl-diaminopimelate desuccinylase